LTGETIEDVIDVVASGERTLDLRDVLKVDVCALLALDLLVRQAREDGRPLRVAWPETPSVRSWMTAMGFFADIKTGLAQGPSSRPSVLTSMASIEREEDVSRLVGAFDDHLSDRFPIDEAPRRRFLRILLELFQNIPQHANATGDVLDPHGLAALEDGEGGILLAVADKGIGLARSLGLRPGSGSTSLSDADALRAIVFDGRSRFRDPGRGHELERIFRLVRSWEGTMTIRSGSALLYQSDLGGDIVNVASFPGVQIALSIPRLVFGIGEPAPLGAESLSGEPDEQVALSVDPWFNEDDETDAA